MLRKVRSFLYKNLDVSEVFDTVRIRLIKLMENCNIPIDGNVIDGVLNNVKTVSNNEVKRYLQKAEDAFDGNVNAVIKDVTNGNIKSLREVENRINDIEVDFKGCVLIDEYKYDLIKRFEPLTEYFNEPYVLRDIKNIFGCYKNDLENFFDACSKKVKKQVIALIASEFFERKYTRGKSSEITSLIGLYHDDEGDFFWTTDDGKQIVLEEFEIDKRTTEFKINENKKFMVNNDKNRITVGTIENGLAINGILVSPSLFSFIEGNRAVTYNFENDSINVRNKNEVEINNKLGDLTEEEKENLLKSISGINKKLAIFLSEHLPSLKVSKQMN